MKLEEGSGDEGAKIRIFRQTIHSFSELKRCALYTIYRRELVTRLRPQSIACKTSLDVAARTHAGSPCCITPSRRDSGFTATAPSMARRDRSTVRKIVWHRLSACVYSSNVQISAVLPASLRRMESRRYTSFLNRRARAGLLPLPVRPASYRFQVGAEHFVEPKQDLVIAEARSMSSIDRKHSFHDRVSIFLSSCIFLALYCFVHSRCLAFGRRGPFLP
jgi:hypothetical protein